MPTGQTDELTARFGATTGDAISRAYEHAIAASTDGSMIGLSTEQRLQLVQVLITEVEHQHDEPEHLKAAATAFLAAELHDTDA